MVETETFSIIWRKGYVSAFMTSWWLASGKNYRVSLPCKSGRLTSRDFQKPNQKILLKKSSISCLYIPPLSELQDCLTQTTSSGNLVRAVWILRCMCQSWQSLLKYLASRKNANTLHLLWQMERKSWKNHCPWITHCQQQKLNAAAK